MKEKAEETTEKKLQQLLNQFKHREVRDLAWTIASPPLVSGNIENTHWWSYEDCLIEFNDCLPALKILDLYPKPLQQHLSTLKNQRLGSIFEGYVSYWLNISPNYREIKQNIQIIEDKHTYGEIDFLIEDLHTHETIHLEVAVKFYLGSAPFKDPYRWFGTNTRDQLGKKIDHLKNHQTQLTRNYAEKLEKYYPEKIHRCACFIKGRLFYPEGSIISPQNIALEKNHLRGTWSYVDQRDLSHDVIKILKSHWLAELNAKDMEELEVSSQASIESIDRAECFVKIGHHELFGAETNDLFQSERHFYLPKAFSFPN